MILFAISVDTPVDVFMQFGAFGLLAFFVFWLAFRGIPGFLATHREAIEKMAIAHEATIEKMAAENKAAIESLVRVFEKDSAECRTERIQTQAASATERERNRELQHESSVAIH